MNLKDFDKIYVLVSGELDSTYLYEKLKKSYGDKVYPVNAWNPYEQSATLKEIAKDPNFIQVFPKEKDKDRIKGLLRESFLKLPEAYKLKKEGMYHKKIFPCCYYIKHKAFLDNAKFVEKSSVVVSGIKRGDGTQRRIWLTQMKNGNNPCNQSNGEPTFFHRHKTGQLYCYPFRDYLWRNLPKICIQRLQKKYPNIKHSGCEICPVLVLYELTDEKERYAKSLQFAENLGVLPYTSITQFNKTREGSDSQFTPHKKES